MSYELRVTGPDEWRAASDTFGLALHFGPISDEEWPQRTVTWENSHSISAWDEGRCVGHGAFFFLATSVPGGEMLQTAGVTRIGVQATHTRRGILTGIMRRMLHDAHDQQRPLASLRASEATIYQRFGYGMSGEAMDVEVRGGRMRPRRRDRRQLPVRRPRRVLRRRAAAVRADRLHPPGRRPSAGLDVAPVSSARSSTAAGPARSCSTSTPTERRTATSTSSPSSPKGADAEATAQVLDLWGANPDAEAALWRYVFDLDLVRVVKAEERPIDDLVKWFLVDRRALKVKSVWDEQWVRLLDVGVALGARARSSDESITIDVRDPILGHNTGRWRIADGTVDHADTDGPADLVVDIAALGAAYMGATSWTEIATTPMLLEPRRPGSARSRRSPLQPAPPPPLRQLLLTPAVSAG